MEHTKAGINIYIYFYWYSVLIVDLACSIHIARSILETAVLVHCLVCISHKITTQAKTNIPAKHYRVYYIVKYVCSAKNT